MKALRYIRQIAQETSGEVVYGLGRQPAVLRTFSQRLSRWLTIFPFFLFVSPFLSDFSITLFMYKFDYDFPAEASMMLSMDLMMMAGHC